MQIKRQIDIITKNENVNKKDIVSTDDFKDLVRIVKEYGQIPLGNVQEPELELEFFRKFSQFAPQPINRHWFTVAKVLDYNSV